MKPIYNILLSFFSIIVYSQNNFEQTVLKDFSINGYPLVFTKDKINCFEETVGKLSEVSNVDNEVAPFIGKKPDKIIENDKISIYLFKNEGYVKYIDMEKGNLLLKYKNNMKFSSATTIEEFKKAFPKSYHSPSYIPGTPPENAVGYTVVVNRKRKKAYLNFVFYYNHLTSVLISERHSQITD